MDLGFSIFSNPSYFCMWNFVSVERSKGGLHRFARTGKQAQQQQRSKFEENPVEVEERHAVPGLRLES